MIQGREVWRARARSPTMTACAAQLRDGANMQGWFLSRSVLGNPTAACHTAWDIPAWQMSTKMPIACLFCLHHHGSAQCYMCRRSRAGWQELNCSSSQSLPLGACCPSKPRLPHGEWDAVWGLSDLSYCTPGLPSWTTTMHSPFTPTWRAGAVPTPTAL